MLCPLCKVELLLADRQGIEIDYCPKCRGVWLDRGELDKLIDRAAVSPASTVQQEEYRRPGPVAYGQPAYHEEQKRQSHGDHKHKKRKSFMAELFDFD